MDVTCATCGKRPAEVLDDGKINPCQQCQKHGYVPEERIRSVWQRFACWLNRHLHPAKG